MTRGGMHHTLTWTTASALILSAPALAAEPAQIAPVHSLSQAEIDRILDAAAARRESADTVDRQIEAEGLRPEVHGEVGFGIGTGGYRSAFGTAVVPMGDGVGVFSFDTTNFGSRAAPYYDQSYER